MTNKLYRSRNNQVVAGVCGGLAEYFQIDPTIIRIIWAVTFFFGGTGLLAYIICALIIPKRPYGYEDEQNDSYDIYDKQGKKIDEGSSASSRITLGVILIIVGGLLFMDRFFSWFNFKAFWPVAIIAVGVVILISGKD